MKIRRFLPEAKTCLLKENAERFGVSTYKVGDPFKGWRNIWLIGRESDLRALFENCGIRWKEYTIGMSY